MAIKYIKGDFVVIPNLNALSNCSSQAQSIFIWMCSYADEYGQCFPSRSTLASLSKFKKASSVDRYIKELCEYGIIEVIKRKGEDKRNLTNIYQILSIGIPSNSV